MIRKVNGMIKLKKVNRDKAPEPLYGFTKDANVFSIKGLEKLGNLCTVLAVTEDLKYVLNTDSCDYYQFEKFNKRDILVMAEDLKRLADMMLQVNDKEED